MTKPDFEKKTWPKFAQIWRFWSFEFESLNFLDFAYYDRRAWYLTGKSDKEAEKKFRAQIRDI